MWQPIPPWARGTAEQPHTCASWAWELMDAQEGTRVQTLQQQLPLPPGSTKNWDMQDTRQSGDRVTQWPASEQAQDYRNALNTVCIQKRSVCGRQLRTGMRVSCDKHGLPPLPPCKILNLFVRGQSTKFCLLLALLFIVV